MKIYHGTNERALHRILTEGIQPRPEDSKGVWEDQVSQAGFVYLTDSHALWFASASCPEKDDRPVIIELDFDAIDRKRLYPDEDYIGQESNLWHGGCHVDDPNWPLDIDKQKSRWRDSLRKLGCVAVKGGIEASAIKRYVVLSNNPDSWDDWYPRKLTTSIRWHKTYKRAQKDWLGFMFNEATFYRTIGKDKFLNGDPSCRWMNEQYWSLVELVEEVQSLDRAKDMYSQLVAA